MELPVLHAIAPVQHGIHHARPQDAIDKIFWQIWLAFEVAAIALANKLARMVWAMMVKGERYKEPVALAA
jgi:hypothetical protein